MDDSAAADVIAAELDDLNRARQAIEAGMLAEAEAEALAEEGIELSQIPWVPRADG